jgi:hypothetical protein
MAKSETFKPYLRQLDFIYFLLVILIDTDPVELQPLREIGSEADLSRTKGGDYLNKSTQEHRRIQLEAQLTFFR